MLPAPGANARDNNTNHLHPATATASHQTSQHRDVTPNKNTIKSSYVRISVRHCDGLFVCSYIFMSCVDSARLLVSRCLPTSCQRIVQHRVIALQRDGKRACGGIGGLGVIGDRQFAAHNNPFHIIRRETAPIDVPLCSRSIIMTHNSVELRQHYHLHCARAASRNSSDVLSITPHHSRYS